MSQHLDLDAHRTRIKLAGTHPVTLSVIDIGPTHEPAPGRGTIVMIHGAAGGAHQWLPQIEHYSPHYRIIAPDLRGHSQSEMPESAYSLEEFLWDLTQILTRLKVNDPFILMAHSFGGPISLSYATAQSEKVSKLVLIATGPEMHLNPIHEFLVKLPIPLRYAERLRPILMPETHAPMRVIQRVLAGTLFRWRGYDLLPTLTVPTLIIGGQWDFIVPVSMLKQTHDLIPGSRLEIVRYTRHLPHLERPDATNRILDRFLESGRSWRDQ